MLEYLLAKLKPFIIFIGAIHAPYSHKKISGKHYYEWRGFIEVGTVLLTKTEGELSNIINPSRLKHAGIYIGNISGIRYVAEAKGEGVVFTDLVTFLTSKDVVVGCKPKFIRGEKYIFDAQLQRASMKMQGIPYDYLFEHGNKAFYCFELAVECLRNIYPEIRFKCREIIKGKRIYDESTFLDPQFFEVVFDSRGGTDAS